MEYRKLKKLELIQLIRVLNDLSLRSYLTDLLKKDAELMNMFKPNNEESNDEDDKDIDKKGIMFSILIDVFGHLLENIENCDENLTKLIKSFLDYESLEEVDEMEADLFTETIKHLIMNEVPKVITKVVNLDNFKKKISQEMSK